MKSPERRVVPMRHRVLPIPFVVLNSVAWRHLNAFAKAAFVDIAACYDRTNNGWIKVPHGELAQAPDNWAACDASTSRFGAGWAA